MNRDFLAHGASGPSRTVEAGVLEVVFPPVIAWLPRIGRLALIMGAGTDMFFFLFRCRSLLP